MAQDEMRDRTRSTKCTVTVITVIAAMTRAAERWRAVKITDFERRQMAALRAEPGQEYEAQTGLKQGTSKAKPQTQLSSTSRT